LPLAPCGISLFGRWIIRFQALNRRRVLPLSTRSCFASFPFYLLIVFRIRVLVSKHGKGIYPMSALTGFSLGSWYDVVVHHDKCQISRDNLSKLISKVYTLADGVSLNEIWLIFGGKWCPPSKEYIVGSECTCIDTTSYLRQHLWEIVVVHHDNSQISRDNLSKLISKVYTLADGVSSYVIWCIFGDKWEAVERVYCGNSKLLNNTLTICL